MKTTIHKIMGITVVGALGLLGTVAGITLGVKTGQKVVDVLENKVEEEQEQY